MTNTALTILPDGEALQRAAVEQFIALAAEAIAARGLFIVALSGGNTPKPIYALLATDAYVRQVDWSKVHVFFGDERCVPPDDAKSNYRMAREALLDHVPLPPANVHRIHGEDAPALAALSYEEDIRQLFRASALPTFDLIWLGMGDNGHTASIFPGTAALREQTRWVIPQYVEVMGNWRVTFTLPLINAARNIAFLVEGAGKADILWRVVKGPYDPDVLPSQLIQPAHGALHWLVDAAAAAKLS